MPYFPANYFPVSAPPAANAYDWTFERVRPAARNCHVRVPAVSTEFHVFRVTAQPPTGMALTAAQIAGIGVDVGYAKQNSDGTYAEPAWLPLSSDTAQNEAMPFAVDFKVFRALVGPNAGNALTVGLYRTLIRAHTSPQVVRTLANLEVT